MCRSGDCDRDQARLLGHADGDRVVNLSRRWWGDVNPLEILLCLDVWALTWAGRLIPISQSQSSELLRVRKAQSRVRRILRCATELFPATNHDESHRQ
jgi:hypothetical protein